MRTVLDFAQSAAFMHEASGGRFRFGIGVARAPGHQRKGLTAGKPLGDARTFVERLRAVEGVGDFPPIIIAALRQKMVALAGTKRDDEAFFTGNMLPTCISGLTEIERGIAGDRRDDVPR
jgi:hypothetical protein